MNLVFLFPCSFDQSNVNFSGTTNSWQNVCNVSPALCLVFIVWMCAKKHLFANTCMYWFPSLDIIRLSSVYVNHSPLSRGFSYILSARYLLANGITADRTILWVVRLRVSVACPNPIHQRSLKSWGVTDVCLSFDSNVCAAMTSCTSTPETCALTPAAPPVVARGGAA